MKKNTYSSPTLCCQSMETHNVMLAASAAGVMAPGCWNGTEDDCNAYDGDSFLL